MFASSLISFASLAYLLYLAEDNLIIFNQMLSEYKRALSQGQYTQRLEAYKVLVNQSALLKDAFPPVKWVSLEIIKVSGVFLGLIVAKVLLTTVIWMKLEVVIYSKNGGNNNNTNGGQRGLEGDNDCIANALLVIAVYFIIGISSFLSICLVNAITLINPDLLLLQTKARFVFAVVTILFALSLLDSHLYPSPAKRMRSAVMAAVAGIVSVWHLLVVRSVHENAQLLQESVLGDDFGLCLQKCEYPFDANEECQQIRVEEFRICDGKIDIKEEFSLTKVWTNKRRDIILIFPDEIYCINRIMFSLWFNYIAGGLALLLAISVCFQLRSICFYYTKRKRDEISTNRYGSVFEE